MCVRYEIEFETQKRKTEEILSPLEIELRDIEEQIKEQVMKVSNAKVSVAKNDQRIQQMLRLIATA